jgi:hypothetical protein
MSSPMLDPNWTPEAGYGHAAALVALCDRTSTIDDNGGTMTTKQGKKTEPAAKPSAQSVKIPPSAYTLAQRIAKKEQRSLGVTIERALAAYAKGERT